jgi:DNA mismatch repair ATPase MutL
MSYESSNQHTDSKFSTQESLQEKLSQKTQEIQIETKTPRKEQSEDDVLNILKEYHENKSKITYGEMQNLKSIPEGKPQEIKIVRRQKNEELGNYKINSYLTPKSIDSEEKKSSSSSEEEEETPKKWMNSPKDGMSLESPSPKRIGSSNFRIISPSPNKTIPPVKSVKHCVSCSSEDSESETEIEQKSQKIEKIEKLDPVLNLKESSKNEILLNCSQKEILKRLKLNNKRESKMESNSSFKARIKKGNEEECERELNRLISRDSFKTMNVVGQYNQAFIIANLNDDLFILDQHACDEKYNYETLFETTTMNTQPLIM